MVSVLAAPPAASGSAMHDLIRELYPICRSITGDGLRATLRRVGEMIPLTLHEVPTGTAVLDWTVPREWTMRAAWIADGSGRRVVDVATHSLHLMSYSVPVRKRMSLAELKPHLHSLPDRPDWIPYRTSYYAEAWGFCLSHRQLESLPDGDYDVCVDTTLAAGSLTYGECVVPGATADEVLISCHCCHPSLANDNLSGLAVAVELAAWAARQPRRFTYRILFIPGTIGSITWLARNEATASRIRHGLVLSCLGDGGILHYKRSRRGNAAVDRAAAHVLRHSGEHRTMDFVPYGFDERQYCSPGFDLPVGCLTRSPDGRFAEYHSSADNPDLVRPDSLEHSLSVAQAIVEVLEGDRRYINRNAKGEPQLGRRGLFRSTGGVSPREFELALLWILSFSDGQHALLDIAERSGIGFRVVRQAADALCGVDLLAEDLGTEAAQRRSR